MLKILDIYLSTTSSTNGTGSKKGVEKLFIVKGDL